MRWFGAVSSQLEKPLLSAHLRCLLPPVARASEDGSGKVHPSVKELASEALALLQRRVQASDFVTAYRGRPLWTSWLGEVGLTAWCFRYTATKEAQRVARRDRKQREALEAVTRPKRAAQKKIAKNLGKRAGKKRKLERMKRSRDSGGSIGLGSGGSKKSRRLPGERG